jgi:integrase
VPLTAITEDELEAFYAALHASGLAASTRNHYVQLLKAMFRWATKKGYLARNPISDDSALKRSKMAQRRRRLSPDEEQAVLEAAGALTRGAGLRLQWLIIAAIESGARLGELLAVRWSDVNLEKHRLLIRAVEDGAKKTGRARELPVSSRLLAVMEMAKLGPVSPESRAALRAIDLHFHDLRHEAGCRWLEAGVPIHHVQEMLGHANLSQTSTYLHAAEMGLQESMKRFDAARVDGFSTDFRGESVVNKAEIEHRPLHHGKPKQSEKGLLH